MLLSTWKGLFTHKMTWTHGTMFLFLFNRKETIHWPIDDHWPREMFLLYASFFYRHSIHFDTYVCLQSDEHRHSNKAHVNKQAQRPLSKEIQRINTDLCIFHKRIFSLFTLGFLLLTHFIALKVQSACNCLLKSVSNDSFQCVNKVMRYW